MPELLNYYNLSLFLGSIVSILSGAIVFFADRFKAENKAWALLNIATAVWSFGYFSMITAVSKEAAEFGNLLLHYGAILIPIFYLLFILTLTDSLRGIHTRVLALGTVAALFFLVINPDSLFVRDVFAKYPFNFAPDAGPLYIYFTAYFFITVLYAIVALAEKVRQAAPGEAGRLRYVLIASIAGFLGGSSVFLLTFSIPIPPYPVALFSFYPVIIAYAMLRYRLFDIKIVATELLIASLWVFLLFRTILAHDIADQLVTGVIFVGIVILGILLIRVIYREVIQREKIEKLAKELETANERLKELDRLKSEFVSLATHQIRGPLAAMRGYASMLLEGDYGELSAQARAPVETIYQSSGSLAGIVQDFLDISRIEQGKMKYEFTVFDFGKLVRSVAEELLPNSENKGLRIRLQIADGLMIHADSGKVRQVIENLIDNAQKYTTGGSIEVTVRKPQGEVKARLEIKDTGVGIKPEVLPMLFQKFSRAEDASKANLKGTGLGLYVAKEFITAQGGVIWAESEGEGKGSTFVVELPLTA